jgi:branched-chain amino acid transport system substrate-binding protein
MPKKPTTKSGKLGIGRRRFLGYSGGAVAAAAASTLAAPAAHAARTVKIGFVSPETGPLAAFGEADHFVLADARAALKKGIKIGRRTYQVEILPRDSQSNPNHAAEVAADLIIKQKVNLMIASSSGDTVNPVSDQCEANDMPCVTSDTPWQVVFFGRGGDPKKGFKWTYHFFWGFDDMIGVYMDMWRSLATNKKIGSVIANDSDGVVAGDPKRGFRQPMEAGGFKYIQPSLFSPGAFDFTSQISQFKNDGVEILTGVATPPDFSTFWGQAAQQGLTKQLKAATIAKALLFPAAVEALGDRGTGLTTEVWWSPSHPFRSGLTGKTSAEFAAAYTAATGKQWTQPMGFKHANIEVAIDVLKRCGDPGDPKAILHAIETTNYNSIVGPVGWKFGGRKNPVKNACRTPLVGGQWKKGKKFKYDLIVVSNKAAPEIKTGGALDPLNR